MSAAIPNAAAAPEMEPTTPVALHPLVIVNITDHFTRNVMRPDAKRGPRAVGALLGQQSGRKVEIFTSFELLYSANGDTIDIDAAFLKERRDSFLAVFPDYDVVGWYTTGKGLSAGDIAKVHYGLLVPEHNESAVALVLDPQPDAKSKNLPVSVFETRQAAKGLAKVPFTVESEESERIGVDAAMKVDFASDGETGLEPSAMRLRSAVDMLQERIAVVVAYLEAVERGTVKDPDYELLRRIADVVNQLPHGDAPQLVKAMQADTRDALLVAFLGVVSKGSALLAHLAADTAVMRDGGVGKKGARLQMLGF